MPGATDSRRLARRISWVLLVLAALFLGVLVFFPRAADTPGEPGSISLAINIAFEAMLLGCAFTLRNPRHELPFLVAKASLCFLLAMATFWQTFETPLLRLVGSLAIFLTLWRVLPQEPDFLAQLED